MLMKIPTSITTQNLKAIYKLALILLPSQKFAKPDITVLLVTGGTNRVASTDTSGANVIEIHQTVWK